MATKMIQIRDIVAAFNGGIYPPSAAVRKQRTCIVTALDYLAVVIEFSKKTPTSYLHLRDYLYRVYYCQRAALNPNLTHTFTGIGGRADYKFLVTFDLYIKSGGGAADGGGDAARTPSGTYGRPNYLYRTHRIHYATDTRRRKLNLNHARSSRPGTPGKRRRTDVRRRRDGGTVLLPT